MMQAPAAPRHELMVQEDGRDWALEQMSQAAAPGTAARASPSTRRPLFEDINGGDGSYRACAPCCSTGAPVGDKSVDAVWEAARV